MSSVLSSLSNWMNDNGGMLIIDTGAGLSLGSLPGLEDFGKRVGEVAPFGDGLVCSPGQLRRLENSVHNKTRLFVRMDWTNTLRGPAFVLPPTNPRRVAILTPQTALELGAAGMVCSILLGYEEEIEASCLRDAVQWVFAGRERGLPTIIEVRATGPRVALRDKAIELGASYALESGADAIAIPFPSKDTLKEIDEFVTVPWFVQPSCLMQAAQEFDDALEYGATGLWLDHQVFALPRAPEAIETLSTRVHAREVRE